MTTSAADSVTLILARARSLLMPWIAQGSLPSGRSLQLVSGRRHGKISWQAFQTLNCLLTSRTVVCSRPAWERLLDLGLIKPDVNKGGFILSGTKYVVTAEPQGDVSGTRTGRMSCNGPNLTNVPNDFEQLVIPASIAQYFAEQRRQEADRVLHDIMHMRQYLLPEEGHVWVKRDFSAQEMRILAHYSEGTSVQGVQR